MGFKDTMTDLVGKLKLDRHHTAERLLLSTSALAVTGALIFTGASASSYSALRGELGSQALYTETFVSSKTETQGSVSGVYRSTDGRRAMAVLEMRDPSTVSQNAEDYQAFVTGSTPAQEQVDVDTPGVTGEIVVFGSTGYIGLVLESEEPFATQILGVTVRANAELAYLGSDVGAQLDEDMAGDTSFAEFDQWRFYFNPGAKLAQTAASLDKGQLDLSDVFYDTVLKPQEDVARGALDEKLAEMRAALNRVQSAWETVQTTSVGDGTMLVLPEPPAEISLDGAPIEEPWDVVEGEPGTQQVKIQEASEALEAGGDSPLTQAELDALKEVPGTGEDSTLRLLTDTVVPGGFEFDWRAGSIQEGYADALAEEGESITSMVRRYADAAQQAPGFNTGEVQWRTNEGEDMTSSSGSSDAALKPLSEAIAKTNQAWSEYYSLKQEYQVELPMALLQLELDLRSVTTSATVHAGAEAVIIY